MKSRKIKLLLILLISAIFFECALAQDKHLKACGNDEYPPWNWMQEGKIVGVCTDLAVRAFASRGYTLDLTYVGPWSRCQYLLNSGAVDVSLCAVPTPERADHLHIIEPSIAYNEIAAFVLQNRKASSNEYDYLVNKRIGMIRGVRLGEPMDTYIERSGQVIYSTRLESLWSLLVLGRVDLVLFGREAGNIQIKQLKLDDRVVALSNPVSKVPLNIMISKKSRHFDSVLNDLYDIGSYFQSKDSFTSLQDVVHENGIKYLGASKKSIPINLDK